MFLDAIGVCGLDLNMLNPLFCYSFVLQHPDNRIVGIFEKPSLYLVEVYEIVNTENGTVYVYPVANRDIGINIPRPKRLEDWSTYEELKVKYVNNAPYDNQGVVLKNVLTNERTKIRNPEYEYVRRLKGNQPKIQYLYLTLRKSGKVGEHLGFYPENKKEFSRVRDRLHEYTELLFQNYIECYIKKMKPLKEYPDNMRTHMFHLHQIYLNELKGKKSMITRTEVIKYVNSVHPTLQLYSINYSVKKRRVDVMSSEFSDKNVKDRR
jgi:hypothetical protein